MKCPESADVLKELGFDQIVNPVMLKTMAKFMTLPKASKMKNIPMDRIIDAFREKGITVADPTNEEQVEGI
ncbi:DUF1858 domain-containing protein [Proteiniclasticum sp. SCR006]|uniref:DUF1858 domain-containing protein n=2 Tax=Proteiniclasticum aestuarii TaxID=2817862 RepID=A0A939HBK1_9CLOT|nr:DUF1858 domain-containing protein [Proteiniclasticum aestuarii]